MIIALAWAVGICINININININKMTIVCKNGSQSPLGTAVDYSDFSRECVNPDPNQALKCYVVIPNFLFFLLE